MKISYRPPEKLKRVIDLKTNQEFQCSVFSTIFPKPMLLAAGNSFTLPVSFSPCAYTTFQDEIEFTIEPILPQCMKSGDGSSEVQNLVASYGIDPFIQNVSDWF